MFEPNKRPPWPIFLALLPTFGPFLYGSSETWSDFIMVCLILYYLYQSITLPWLYYKTNEKRNEFISLGCILISPFIASYSVRYSRYLLYQHDLYLTQFNLTIFLLASLIKPFLHLSHLLKSKPSIPIKNDWDNFKKSFATKKELDKVTPNLSRSIERLEKRESESRRLFEKRFLELEERLDRLERDRWIIQLPFYLLDCCVHYISRFLKLDKTTT